MMTLPPSTLENISPPDLTYPYFKLWHEIPFTPKPDFNLVNAWRLSEFALLAYAGADFVATKIDVLKNDGYSVESDGRNETEYLFVRGRADVIVAFRGTEIDNFWGSLSDWLTDFKLRLQADAHGSRIHEGFTAALNRVWKDVEGRMKEVLKRDPNIRIWITGHSLGAALATLAAYRASMDGAFNVHAVYTYGSPKVGDRVFKSHLIRNGVDARIFRFRNHNDLVTRVPPSAVYNHVGSPQFIDNSGHLHVGSEAPEERGIVTVASAIADAIELIPSLVPALSRTRIVPGAIADHAPTYYTLHLFNNLHT
jgi:triacylglycerol lipase